MRTGGVKESSGQERIMSSMRSSSFFGHCTIILCLCVWFSGANRPKPNTETQGYSAMPDDDDTRMLGMALSSPDDSFTPPVRTADPSDQLLA